MTTLTADQIEDIERRHPDAFRQPFFKRFAYPIAVVVLALYTVYAWWFFSIGSVISNGNWNIAGAYLADWVSYEVRPDVEYKTGDIEITYPRFSPLGENPDPSWITTERGLVTVSVEGTDTERFEARQHRRGRGRRQFHVSVLGCHQYRRQRSHEQFHVAEFGCVQHGQQRGCGAAARAS
jgi:hypothetical protein